MRSALLGVAAAAAIGCGGAAKGPATPASGTGSSGHGEGGAVDITAAALPYKVLRTRGGTEITSEQLLAELGAARAVCIGESHKNPHHHWAQLHLFDQLSKAGAARGVQIALGMEMFQRPFQGVLDDYAAGRISETDMLARTGYEQRWGYDWGFYAPTVALAIERGHPVLALNTERELTKRLSRNGLDALTAEEKAKLPELVLDDPVHRAWWDQIMSEMGGAHGDPHGGEGHGNRDEDGDEVEDEDAADGENQDAGEDQDQEKSADDPGERIYAAQVLWDETMAEGAVRWLAAGPQRQIVILAGNGHCHDSAIVGRIKRRGIEGVLSVRPILEAGDGRVAAALAQPRTDYLMVMTIPK